MPLTSEKLHKQTLKEQRIAFSTQLFRLWTFGSRVESRFNYRLIIPEVALLSQSGGHRVPVYVRISGL